jgi:hypothetical protein
MAKYMQNGKIQNKSAAKSGPGIVSWSGDEDHGHDLTDVDVGLFNEISRSRETLRDSIRNIGFRPVRTNVLGTLDKLRSAVSRDEIDFLLLEPDESPVKIREFVRDIRQGRLGSNPYLVISIITWRADNQMINDFVNAGADDLIAMPASLTFTSGRVDNLIDHRREFVVTRNYVGPDRCAKTRVTIDELGTIVVPNGLRYKVTGDESAAPSRARLRQINQVVETHMLRRMTLRLEQLAAQAERFATEHPGEPLPSAPLTELLDLVKEIETRTGNDGSVSVAELIASMNDIMQAILAVNGGRPDMFALLKVHGQALLAIQRGEKQASGLVLRAVRTAKQVVEQRSQAA